MEEVPDMALFGFGDRRLEEEAHADQLRGDLATAVEIEPFEGAAAFENGAARLPKRATGFRARGSAAGNLLQTADSAHSANVRRRSRGRIGRNAHGAAGNYGFEAPVTRLDAGQRRSSLCNSART